MVQEPVIVEISSDEEDEVICKSGAEPLNFYSSMDWLDSMLRLDSDPWISGDMEVVKELSWPPQEEELAIVPYVAEQCVSNNDSDDDCIILDGDPDKPAEAILEKPDCVDELVIVSEKGQVPCRDFPHSRHICANFPFVSTSHDKFCKMCHCYVCDVPAPCTLWALHCHSSDKEERWILERKSLRKVNKTPQTLAQNPTQKPPGVRHRLPPAFQVLLSMGTNPSRAALPPFRRCSVVSLPMSQPQSPYLPISCSLNQPDLSSCVPKVPAKRPRTNGYNHPVSHQRMPVPLLLPAPPLPKLGRNTQMPPNLGRNAHPPPHPPKLGTNSQPPPSLPKLGRNSRSCPQFHKSRSYSRSQTNPHG